MTERHGHALVAAVAFAFGLAILLAAAANAGGAANDGASARTRSELWRMSGRLASRDGRAFDYSVSFFRFARAHGAVLYPATVSIVDEAANRRVVERRTERETFGLAAAASDRLAVRAGNWWLREGSVTAARSFDLDITLAEGALHMRGTANKPRITLSDDGPDAYAYTSIDTKASLTLGGSRLDVAGKAWLDHETSDGAAPQATTRVGKFCVQLDDGREILVETSQPSPGDFEDRRAYLIRRDGTLVTLAHSRYEFANHLATTWLSPHTRVRYPDLWSLHVDGETERLALEPVRFDQENVSAGDGSSFWDGAVDVFDVTPGSQGSRLGSGFVLLAGYAKMNGDE